MPFRHNDHLQLPMFTPLSNGFIASLNHNVLPSPQRLVAQLDRSDPPLHDVWLQSSITAFPPLHNVWLHSGIAAFPLLTIPRCMAGSQRFPLSTTLGCTAESRPSPSQSFVA